MENESLFAFGPLCNVDDPNTIIRAARLCDELGMELLVVARLSRGLWSAMKKAFRLMGQDGV
ncbi:MAG: hypothetical protein CM1200mP15_14510 [Dehalococcoidia bacterium]|nr:MAG: hypothetical protein CM1200mP15_14510 [Dehalococcoidia bacterium]